MIPFENLVFELASYAIALAILWKLAKDPNRFHLIAFLVAIVTTATIELFGVREGHGYYYGDYLVVISQVSPFVLDFFGTTGRDVPLVIAVDWAIIIFCFWRLGDRLNLTWYWLPPLYAMLAVVLDFALDPIAASSREIIALGDDCLAATAAGAAEGIGYWVWCIPATPNQFWFGVPIQNFYGWFLVVAVFTYFLLIAHRNTYTASTGTQIAGLLAAMTASIALFLLVLGRFLSIDLGIWGWTILGTLMLFGLIALVLAGKERRRYDVDWWALIATLSIVLVSGFLYLFYLRSSVSFELVIGVALSLIVSLALTLWLMFGKRLLGQTGP